MSFLKDKVNSVEVSNNSRKFLEAIINPKISILKVDICESLYKTILNQLKKDNSLLSFLLNLVDLGEERYIKLPHYININPRKLKDTEFLLRENGKYGVLLNMISNRKTFNFSMRLRDMTIIVYDRKIEKQTRGSYRSFTLTDRFGNISENWKTLRVYTIDEKKKIFDNHDKSEIITHQFFISDDISNFLKDIKYFLLKLYIKRLEMERDYWVDISNRAQERLSNFDHKFEMKQIREFMKDRKDDNC